MVAGGSGNADTDSGSTAKGNSDGVFGVGSTEARVGEMSVWGSKWGVKWGTARGYVVDA